MNDVRATVVARLAGLDVGNKIIILATIINKLSFEARDTYDKRGGVSDCKKLRQFNEAINRVSSQMIRLLAEDERRYPDEVFANILADQFEALRLDPKIIFADSADG
jgi:hypothetical protein